MEQEEKGEQPIEQENVLSGSPKTKFQSVEELEKAYQNLEKEFTRKSQILNKMQSEKNSGANSSEVMPFFEQENWAQDIQIFLQENPKAKPHAQEISVMLMEDKDLQQANNPLLKAWQKWLTKNYKEKEDYLLDEQFFDELCQNEKLKSKIINNYLSEIKKRDDVPPISLFGFSGVQNNNHKSATLEEAKELAKKLFNK